MSAQLPFKERGKLTKEEDVVVAPERHEYARCLVNRSHLDVREASGFPDTHLTITHPAESSSSDVVLITHPGNSGTL